MKHKKILAVVLACTLTGCVFASVLATIEKWEPTFAQGFADVMAILQEDGVIKLGTQTVINTYAAKITADFGELGSDVTAARASSSAATGALNKTIADLGSIEGDLTQLNGAIPGLSIPPMDIQDAQQSLSLLALAVSGFQTELTPVAALPPEQMKAALKKAKLPKVEDFKKQWNLIQVSNHRPEKQL